MRSFRLTKGKIEKSVGACLDVGFYTRNAQCAYLAQDPPNTYEPSPLSEQTAPFAKRSYGGGADASGVPGLCSSTGEDETLGVVAIMVDEICDI